LRSIASTLFQIGEQRRLRFLVGQRFGALLAAFHDELVERSQRLFGATL
jgi:hypothetical protein